MTQNDCYKQGKTLKPQGIMVHSTDSQGVMAAAWFARWNKHMEVKPKCVHAFVDDKEVWQYLPWTMKGWHGGGSEASGKYKSVNNTHIGFEI
jgi:N-acetylmuramoyl-L-alanine amidase